MSEKRCFHPGELAMHEQALLGDKAELLSKRLVADHMSLQHQDFFPLLSTLFVASIDQHGRPWASVLIGQPGFVSALDETHLSINEAMPVWSDPLRDNVKFNPHLGILGLQFETRRRNRINGKLVRYQDNQMQIEVTQAFGNCPKYIQSRRLNLIEPLNSLTQKKDVQHVTRFDESIRQLIEKSDTFFIASYYPQAGQQSADISHRGGQPGFVTVENDNTLSFDDFAGNNLYMTLGNLISHPVAGLLFIDFESGDTIQLSCHSEIIDTPNASNARRIRLTLEAGVRIKAALPVQWEFLGYSPFIKG